MQDDELFAFIAARNVAGRRLGYVDIHLLASTVHTPDALIRSRDKRLAELFPYLQGQADSVAEMGRCIL